MVLSTFKVNLQVFIHPVLKHLKKVGNSTSMSDGHVPPLHPNLIIQLKLNEYQLFVSLRFKNYGQPKFCSFYIDVTSFRRL